MKKIISLILMFTLLLSFASCIDNKDEPKETESKNATVSVEVGSLTNIVENICAENNLTSGKTYTSESKVLGEYLDKDLISGFYGSAFESPDFTKIEEYCVYIDEHDTNLRIEIGIFKTINSNDNITVENFIKQRKETKIEEAINYPAINVEPFKNVIIDTIGNYTYYIVVKENRDAINSTVKEKLGA